MCVFSSPSVSTASGATAATPPPRETVNRHGDPIPEKKRKDALKFLAGNERHEKTGPGRNLGAPAGLDYLS